ncbi:MAG: imidazole glycerol phosphate synthase subunit HisF [Flavobacteriales bacterium]|nr:MAG: imidazole glycerol phosphate synthase subunit HisF [Flavobacteriales bacterium]
MYRPRIIPVLLLHNNGLVKTVKFGNNTYIGDPINAVRIFNDLKVDEIVLLDIDATKENRTISIDLVKEVGEEANMPFSVGGGIKDIETIKKLTQAGAERVILSSYAIENPSFVKKATEHFGSSTICVCIDYKKTLFGKQKVHIESGKKNIGRDTHTIALEMQNAGAGEVIIQSINKDGAMTGYDLEMITQISKALAIPVIALGGAGSITDIEDGYKKAYANGLAVGSFFVFKGKHRGVLIQYPDIKSYNFK